MLQKGLFLLLAILFTFQLAAQKATFNGTLLPQQKTTSDLANTLRDWSIYEVDTDAISNFTKANNGNVNVQLQFGQAFDWQLDMTEMAVVSPDVLTRVVTENGIEEIEVESPMAMVGYREGHTSDQAVLTVNDGFLYGYVEMGKKTYYVEPLYNFVDNAPANQVIIYEESQVIPNGTHTCGATEREHRKHTPLPQNIEEKTVVQGDCFIVDYAVGADFLMFQNHGSTVVGVQNQIAGVTANVNTDYDTDFFLDQVEFQIVEFFIVQVNGGDPWSNSTDAGTFLDSFTAWGPGGFSVVHDLGGCWTNRNFDGSTIGVAWLGVVCSNSRYHVLEDFSATAWALRVLTSHEIGHNFSIGHDAGGTDAIMAPAVSNTVNWSANSINVMEGYIHGLNCLANCPPPNPPVVQFSSSAQQVCTGSFVRFFDESTNSPNAWNWSFSGGTPASSTDRFPVVQYNNPGTYAVTLTATNNIGPATQTLNGFVNVGAGTDLFFFEGFENGAGSFTIENPDGATTWEAMLASGGRGNQAMRMDCFNYNAAGQRDRLISPSLDLTDRADPSIQIEYAYARYNSQFRDSLVVKVSTNGGATWAYVFADTDDGAGNFSTAPDQTSLFEPSTADNWCYSGYGNGCLDIDISAYGGNSNVQIQLECVNGFGNSMFIENVGVQSSCAVAMPPSAAFTADITSGCAPLGVQYTDQSAGANAWNWSFPGGTPSSSTEQNPFIVYNNIGTYTATLNVSNNNGSDTESFTNYITVEDIPTASFIETFNGGLSYTFTNTSTNANSYNWNFGDGQTSNQTNPTHTYATAGTYDVLLTANGPCGQNSFIIQVTIESPPTAGFTANVTEGCAPFNVTFTNTSSENATNFAWTFGAGATPSASAQENPTVTYNAPGVYDVTLLVSNAQGSDTYEEFAYIIVNDVPTPAFSTNENGQTVDFFNNSTNATSYFWDFGDSNTSSDFEPTHTYNTDGTYEVTLSAENICGTIETTQTIVISTQPVAGFFANQNSGCAPYIVQFTDNSSDNSLSWFWEFGPNATPSTSTDINPSVTYNAAGVYDVILTVSNAAGDDTFTEISYISVDDVPITDFSTTIIGSDVDFLNSSDNADSYLWDFGNNETSTQTNPTQTFADGTYEVSLTSTNACGSITETQTITIATPPTAAFTANVTDGCTPFVVEYTSTSSENVEDYAWDFGADAMPPTSTDPNPTVTYNTAGTYSTTLTVTNTVSNDVFTETNLITVNSAPIADFNAVPNELVVEFTNTSTNGDTYAWDFGDDNTSDEENPTHTYDADGTYQVILVVTNDCGSITTTETIMVSTAPVAPTAGFSASVTTGCAPFEVQFNNESSENVEEYAWDFGADATPSTSTDPNPTVTFNVAGTYSVVLVVTNVVGSDTYTETDYIVVNVAPTADFTTTIDGLDADFTNVSTNGDTYAWDFGDDNTSNLENPMHTYDADGTYEVVLVVTNDCGSITSTETVVMITPPTANFTATATEGCAPFEVQFNNESSENASTYAWDFGADATPSTSTDPNPTVTYATAGTYSVTLVVTNAAGESTATETNYIVVNPMPTAAFTSSTTLLDATFTNTSTNATTYAWDFGDNNTSDLENPTHTYAADGTYEVVLVVTNDCASMTFTETLSIVTPPSAGFTANMTEGCAPFDVQFSNQSSENAATYAWDFGANATPSTSTAANPTVSYATSGTYGVTLTVTNAAGEATAMEMNYIVVNPMPTADFIAVPNQLDYSFTNNSMNGTTYAWDFGDAMTSDLENPTHTYAAEGTYVVTLTVTNDCGTVTTTETVMASVAPVAPTASFTANAITGCAPFEVQFTNQSSENVDTYSWDFGPNAFPSNSVEANPIVSFTVAGVYTVSLTVTNSVGSDTYSEMNFIVVNPAPAADFTATPNALEVVFTSPSTNNADTYAWTFGDNGTSDLQNPIHTYAADGTYEVTLTVTNACGTISTTQMVTVSTAPVAPTANFTADATTGCAPFTVAYSNLSTENATAFMWTFEGGTPATSTDENPVVVYNTPGVYATTLTASNAVGESTYTETGYINILDAPSADFSFTVNELTVNFNNTSTNIGTVSWNFDDNNTSDETSPVHTYDVAGTYEVVLTITNDCGTSTQTLTVIVSDMMPLANFDADDRDGCAPHTVQFMDASTNGATDWLWTFPGADVGTSTAINPVITYSTPGDYSVTLQVTNSAGGNTITKDLYISIIDVPVASFNNTIDDLSVFFENTSTFGETYAWEFGDDTGSSTTSPTHIYDEPGTYSVSLTVTNECGENKYTEEITITPDGVNSLTFVDDFRVYPNPNTGQFTIALTGQPFGDDLTINVVNVLGQIIHQETAGFGTGRLERSFDFKNLAAGVYFVQINADKQTMYRKVVVE